MKITDALEWGRRELSGESSSFLRRAESAEVSARDLLASDLPSHDLSISDRLASDLPNSDRLTSDLLAHDPLASSSLTSAPHSPTSPSPPPTAPRRARLESELLLAFALGVGREWLHAWGEREVESGALARFEGYIARRKSHEPFEYITQSAGFYSREFFVSHGVLVPRPESELLIDKAREVIARSGVKRVGEIGVGSGVLAITLALECPDISVVATDISQDALAIAQTNIARHHTQSNRLKERITLRHASLLDGIEEQIDLLISNPPYIAQDYALDASVMQEPHCALFGGVVGDEILLEIIALAREREIEHLICEMGYDQRESLSRALGEAGFEAEFYQDYALWDRGFVAHR